MTGLLTPQKKIATHNFSLPTKYVTMTKEYKIDDRFLPSNSFGTHLLTLKATCAYKIDDIYLVSNSFSKPDMCLLLTYVLTLTN